MPGSGPLLSTQLRSSQERPSRKCSEIVYPAPSREALTEDDYKQVCDCLNRGRIGFVGGFAGTAVVGDLCVGKYFPSTYRFGGLLVAGLIGGAYVASRRMTSGELDLSKEDSKLKDFLYPEPLYH